MQGCCCRHFCCIWAARRPKPCRGLHLCQKMTTCTWPCEVGHVGEVLAPLPVDQFDQISTGVSLLQTSFDVVTVARCTGSSRPGTCRGTTSRQPEVGPVASVAHHLDAGAARQQVHCQTTSSSTPQFHHCHLSWLPTRGRSSHCTCASMVQGGRGSWALTRLRRGTRLT